MNQGWHKISPLLPDLLSPARHTRAVVVHKARQGGTALLDAKEASAAVWLLLASSEALSFFAVQ